MPSQKIEMHFKEIMNLSEQVRVLGEEIRRKAQEDMMSVISNTKAAWNSKCADLLVGKEVRLNGRLMQEADELIRLADGMREQAENMYHMEMTNNLLAQARIYL